MQLSNPTNADIIDNAATGTILDDETTYIHLPMVLNDYPNGPDLVVDELIVDGTSIEVTISNQGDRAVYDEFWVDVYIKPTVVPTAVNQTIDTLNSDGAVWA